MNISARVLCRRLRTADFSIGRLMSDIPVNLKDWRKAYLNDEEPFLLESLLPHRDPFKLYHTWFENVAAKKDLSFEEVNAVCVSTVGQDLRPSSRMVLMKSYDKEGFTFFSNKTSRKYENIAENKNACMLFYWPSVHRQVRIEGEIRELPVSDADEYWNSRPLASRIGSKSSVQGAVVPNREFLLEKKKELEELAEKEGESAITRPETWCGFKLIPRYFEFWQGQSNRLHDRIIFSLEKDKGEEVENNWFMYRLSP
ncbi:unnamed protein product [Auanema sp. JU1783]|nr:unnamed protein product [Auanema sp. JU1783]